MTFDEAVTEYSMLPQRDKLRVLAKYAHWLTIVGRGTYMFQSDDVADPRRLRTLNEIQHRVVDFIGSLADGKRPWCDDTMVVQIAVGNLDSTLLNAFGQSLQECR